MNLEPIESLQQPYPQETLSESRVCRFTTLDPYRDGVGAYHINTHIAFFQVPEGRTPQQLTQLLYNQFPSYFNPNPVAAVRAPNCRHNGLRTLKFTADMPGPDLHDDWVALNWRQSHFFAETLERQWQYSWERRARAVSYVGPAIPGGAIPSRLGRLTLDVNRKHFLAGRRSWRVGLLENPRLLFLETAAFERFSDIAFVASSPVVGIPAQILETWTTLLENFGRVLGLQSVNYLPSGYSQNRGVAYRRAEGRNAQTLRSKAWFSALLSRHSGL